MKPQNPLLFVIFLLSSLCARSQDSTAQTVVPAPDTVAVAVDPFLNFMMTTFQFERPDSTFEKIPNVQGYENKYGARVSYVLFPAPFASVVKDFSKKRLGGSDSILIQKKASVNGVNGFLVKLLYKSADSSHEDHYGLFFLFPHQNGTVNMVSVYPKSQDQMIYANVLKSFGTMKQSKEELMTVKQ